MEINNDYLEQLIIDINNIRFNRKRVKAYNVHDVDEFLDILIDKLSENEESTLKLKKIEYLISKREFRYSFTGYNIKDVDEFFDNLSKRLQI